MPIKLFISFFLLLISTWFLFQTGLSGSFILDDVPNLMGLSALNDNPSLTQYLQFIFHNTHINMGRPVSYFFFSLQAADWPNPIPFKQFNIGLHLINGVLIYWLSHKLITRSFGISAPLMSLGITTLWLLSPIQVDTVQYTVQRMAILATTFTLLGLMTYTYARTLIAHTFKAVFLLYIIFGLCLILAVLSKENGLLLVVLVILLEFSLFRNEPRPNYYKAWFGLAIILPLLLFAALLLYKFDVYFLYSFREFSSMERFWTQQGIILHYISSILAPSTSKLTLFYDDYLISQSLLSPPSTLFFLLLNSFIILSGFFTLKRWPLFGFGILFFYANHLMESTFLGLELYFEHRNYLAIFGISLSLFSGIYYLRKSIAHKNIHTLMYTIPMLLIIVSIWVNYQQNKIWSNPLYQAHIWYKDHPSSQRAHGNYGFQLNHAGFHKEAVEFYRSTLALFPEDPTKPLLWLEITCNPEISSAPPRDTLLHKVRNGKHYKESIAIMYNFIRAFEAQRCPGVSISYFLEIVNSFQENPLYTGKTDKLNLMIIKYRTHQLNNNYRLAAKALEKAVIIEARTDILSALAEKYIYLNQLEKAWNIMQKLESYCSKHPIKCANSKKNIMILNNLYDSALQSLNSKKNNS